MKNWRECEVRDVTIEFILITELKRLSVHFTNAFLKWRKIKYICSFLIYNIWFWPSDLLKIHRFGHVFVCYVFVFSFISDEIEKLKRFYTPCVIFCFQHAWEYWFRLLMCCDVDAFISEDGFFGWENPVTLFRSHFHKVTILILNRTFRHCVVGVFCHCFELDIGKSGWSSRQVNHKIINKQTYVFLLFHRLNTNSVTNETYFHLYF